MQYILFLAGINLLICIKHLIDRGRYFYIALEGQTVYRKMGARLLPVLLLIIRFSSEVSPLQASTLHGETKTQTSKAVDQSLVQSHIETKNAPPYPYSLQLPNFHQGIQPPPNLSNSKLGRSATVIEHKIIPQQYHNNPHQYIDLNNYAYYGEPKLLSAKIRKPSKRKPRVKGDKNKKKDDKLKELKKDPLKSPSLSEKETELNKQPRKNVH